MVNGEGQESNLNSGEAVQPNRWGRRDQWLSLAPLEAAQHPTLAPSPRTRAAIHADAVCQPRGTSEPSTGSYRTERVSST